MNGKNAILNLRFRNNKSMKGVKRLFRYGLWRNLKHSQISTSRQEVQVKKRDE